MTSIKTDGSTSLTGKKVGLLKRMSDPVAEVHSYKDLIFYCIIHHEILCQGVLDMKHVVDTIVKIGFFYPGKMSDSYMLSNFLKNVVRMTMMSSILSLYAGELSQMTTTHLPTLETMTLQITSSKKYTNMISALDFEFTSRFEDFQKHSGEFESCHHT
ncbi:hypothetical protein RF11_04255 [Thelohanellus kitauei]|uniref:Uncharacterized protein n=1 Tax=Thelohanellus kitauei TaxID=669202 RepID=A0A0C2ND45_THEKT|nr:hypothetical protein RF11_04255 [Thelohanellus kitauei]